MSDATKFRVVTSNKKVMKTKDVSKKLLVALPPDFF